MNVFKRIPFIGIILLVIASFAFSKVITSTDYSKSKFKIDKRDGNKNKEGNSDVQVPFMNNNSNIYWVDLHDIYWVDSGNLYWINIGNPFWSSDPSDDSLLISRDQIITNLKNILQLGEKEKGVIAIVEKMLNSSILYNLKFIAGVIANLINEGNTGKFENSNYKTNPEKEPDYLVYMDKYFNYRNEYSNKSITKIGIKNATDLAKKAIETGKSITHEGQYNGMFGLGIAQWTGDRTVSLMGYYNDYKNNDDEKDKPSFEKCVEIETDYFMYEIEEGDFKNVYKTWKDGGQTSYNAGKIFCKEFEKPNDEEREKSRGNEAIRIYSIMTMK